MQGRGLRVRFLQESRSVRSRELRENLLRGEALQRRFDLDARIRRVALGWDAADFKNQRLEFFRAGVLPRGCASFARNVLFHQRSAVVVGTRMQAKLRELAVQL